ncbi:hypothetical protein OF83DRAFT_492020 [Amylostereum chailletii]|nr:hypothetical protein OF83DRAFT_492020 [Amylostereum chailletii]
MKPASLVLFPGEGKSTEHARNKNRLVYDLSTCLHQQESLGLATQENFGFVFANGVVRIYGMEKQDDSETLFYTFLDYKFATFDLRTPLGFLNFYSFLCKLANHLDATIVKDFLNGRIRENQGRADRTAFVFR